MTAHVLARDNGRTGRHADNILIVGALIIDARCRKAVDHRCACDLPAIAAKCVVALLIRRHEKNFASQTTSSQVSDWISLRLMQRLVVGDAFQNA